MICPEVWQFEHPKCSTHYKYGILEAKFVQEVKQKISSHFFNEMISIVLPDTPETWVQSLEDIIVESGAYYLVKNIPADQLINRIFVESFIKRGQFYAISHDTHLDTDDCLTVTPCGKLILHLNKEVYQSLGLEGRPSQFSPKSKNKFVVEIDLKSPDLCHGKKYFEKTKQSLANKILTKFNLALTWHSPDASICPSSVAKYFVDQGYEVVLQTPKVKRRCEYEVAVPVLGDPKDATRNFCTLDEMVEFVGILTLGCDRGAREGTSTYQVFGETDTLSRVKVLTCKGMFSAELVEAIFEKLRENIDEKSSWVSLYVHGNANSVVSFSLKEHNFSTMGGHSYLIAISPTNHCLYYQCVTSNKIPK